MEANDKVGSLSDKYNLAIPIMIDYDNNQKHLTVSRLTAQDMPKRTNCYYDVKMRSEVMVEIERRMHDTLYQYILIYSEK